MRIGWPGRATISASAAASSLEPRGDGTARRLLGELDVELAVARLGLRQLGVELRQPLVARGLHRRRQPLEALVAARLDERAAEHLVHLTRARVVRTDLREQLGRVVRRRQPAKAHAARLAAPSSTRSKCTSSSRASRDIAPTSAGQSG